MSNITKIENGFSFNDKNYTFKKFIVIDDSQETEASTEIVDANSVHVGTDKGVIYLTTDITVDGNTHASVEEFITTLFK
jgi:hypothetical protein